MTSNEQTAVVGLNIPGYHIQQQIAVGGMSTVYLAVQQSVERLVALKVISKTLVDDPVFSERFLREAKIVAQLSHPNIVSVYDVGEHDGTYYIAMEYLPNSSLKAKLQEGISLDQAIAITSEISNALDYAHRQGYVHRDVKPANILFRSDGTPILTDFGIARSNLTKQQMTMTGTVLGTPHYMSPEQALGRPVDSRSDIYSLGAMLYEMLAGHVPYDSDSAIAIGIKHISDQIPSLPDHLAYLQPVIDAVMAKEPEHRIQSGAALMEALSHAVPANNRDIQLPPNATNIPTMTDTVVRPPTDAFAAIRQTQSNRAALSGFSSEAMSEHASVQGRRSGFRSRALLISVAIAAIVIAAFPLYSVFVSHNLTSPDEITAVPHTVEQTSTEQKQPDEANRIAEAKTAYAQALAIVQREQAPNVPDLSTAISLLQTVLRHLPAHSEARSLLAQISNDQTTIAQSLEVRNLLTEALPHYQVAARAAPENVELQNKVAALQTVVQQEYATRISNQSAIAKSLKLAKLAYAENRLTTPAASSAFKHYQDILYLDPANQEALQGIQTIAEYYIQRARQALDRKQFDSAQNAIDKVAMVAPESPELDLLKSTLSQKASALASQQREERIAAQKLAQQKTTNKKFNAHIKKGNAALDALFVTNSDIKLAIDHYNQAIQLKANDKQAEGLLSAIVAKVEQQVNVDLNKKNYAMAYQSLKTTNDITPTPAQLSTLKTKVELAEAQYEKVRAAEKEKNLRLEQLLARAKNMQRANMSDLGSYKTIINLYNEAKAISPHDNRITDGLNDTKSELRKSAQQVANNSKIDVAYAFVDGSLNLFPNDSGLLKIKKELDEKQLQQNMSRPIIGF